MELSNNDQKLLLQVKEFLKNNPIPQPAFPAPNRDRLANEAIELLDKAYELINNQVNSQS